MAAQESQSETDTLMNEAFALLEAGESDQALTIGRRLESLRFSGGFEIQALAYQSMGENKKAIRVLKNGTERVPGVWLLWNLLGNCLSDEGSFEEALAAYDSGIDLPDSDKLALQFNSANVLWRSERLEEANAKLVEMLANSGFMDVDPNLKVCIHRARVGVLSDLGLYQDAIAHFDSLTDPEEWSEFPAEAAGLDAKYAEALWRSDRGEDAEKVVARAIQRDKKNEEAQWLLREMRRPEDPAESVSYKLLIHGPWLQDASPDNGQAEGFYSTYQVVADDLKEALAFVREFEPPEIRDALEIEEVKLQERCAEPKGVYWTSGYTFYGED